MSNPFKQFNFDDSHQNQPAAPASIKTKVMGTYNFIAGAVKILELFIGNVSNSVVELIKIYEGNQQKTPPTPPESEDSKK